MAKQQENGTKIAAAAGVAAAAAAAAAGAYWLYGAKDAQKHRKLAKSWMLKARAEVMEGMEKLGEVDKETYMQLAGEVAKRYAGAAGVTAAESAKLVKDLKSGWAYLQTQKKPAAKKVKAVQKSAKKVAKKARR